MQSSDEKIIDTDLEMQPIPIVSANDISSIEIFHDTESDYYSRFKSFLGLDTTNNANNIITDGNIPIVTHEHKKFMKSCGIFLIIILLILSYFLIYYK